MANARTVLRTEMHGFNELEELFRKLGPEIATNVGWLAVAEGARDMQQVLRRAAPLQTVGPHGGPPRRIKSWRVAGRLRKDGTRGTRSRKAYYGSLRENIVIRRPRKIRNPNAVILRVSTGNAFWGYFLEYGTKKMAARPWFRPAMDGNAMKVQKIIARSLGKNFPAAAKMHAQKQMRLARRSLARARKMAERRGVSV